MRTYARQKEWKEAVWDVTFGNSRSSRSTPIAVNSSASGTLFFRIEERVGDKNILYRMNHRLSEEYPQKRYRASQRGMTTHTLHYSTRLHG